MIIVKITAAIALLLLLSTAAWGLTHLGRIKNSLNAANAMPRPVPTTNFVLWLSILFIALASLLIGAIFY